MQPWKLVFVSFTLAASTVLAAKYECKPSTWKAGSGVKNGLFAGTIVAECTFAAAETPNYDSLNKYLQDAIIRDADVVHSGPDKTTVSGMPAVHFDVTDTQEKSGNKVTVRSDVNLATDSLTTFVQTADSKKVTGEGAASGLQKVSGTIVVKTMSAGKYSVVLESYLSVKKPSLLPSPTFESLIKNESDKAMKEAQETVIKTCQENL